MNIVITSTEFKTFNIYESENELNSKRAKTINLSSEKDEQKAIEEGTYYSADHKISFEYRITFGLNTQFNRAEFREWHEMNLSHVSTGYCKAFAESVRKWDAHF